DGDPFVLSLNLSGPYPLGTNEVVLTVLDNHSASSSCSATVTVIDTTAPIIGRCAAALTASATANCQAAVPDFTGAVTASDNCTAAGALAISQDPAAGTLVGLGTNTVVITATDASGNSSPCATQFIVQDSTRPTITCPDNIVTPVPAPQTTVVVIFDTPLAGDNCSTPTVACDPPSGSTFSLGTRPVVCTATDDAGNTRSCTFTVTVNQTGVSATGRLAKRRVLSDLSALQSAD